MIPETIQVKWLRGKLEGEITSLSHSGGGIHSVITLPFSRVPSEDDPPKVSTAQTDICVNGHVPYLVRNRSHWGEFTWSGFSAVHLGSATSASFASRHSFFRPQCFLIIEQPKGWRRLHTKHKKTPTSFAFYLFPQMQIGTWQPFSWDMLKSTPGLQRTWIQCCAGPPEIEFGNVFHQKC